MRKQQRWVSAALTAALGAALIVAAPAHSQKPLPPMPLPQAVANKSKLGQDDVAKMLDALGPVIRDKLANGETVELPGLGRFRVVQVAAHKDMVRGTGEPVTVAAANYVEFMPTAVLNDAANSPNAVPAVTVPQFEYNPLPDQTKGQKSNGIRTGGTRVP